VTSALDEYLATAFRASSYPENRMQILVNICEWCYINMIENNNNLFITIKNQY
jgi:hypothetical protein